MVGIVGALAPWKGFETFLDAAALVWDLQGDVVFFIVSDE